MIKTSETVLRKIYLSLYLKRLCVRGSWRPNRTATYWTPLRFFPVLLGCSTEGLEAQTLWVLVFSTASYLHWSGLQTNWFPVLPSYIIVQHPPSSCGRHKLHSFPHPRSRLHSAIPRPDAPVIYIGAFPILTVRPGRWSIYNNHPPLIFQNFTCEIFLHVCLHLPHTHFTK